MRGEAGVGQEAVDVAPLLQTAIVEKLEVVCDDERHNVVCQTLLEHQQTSHTTVAVLERMNLLEAHVKIEDVIQRLSLVPVVVAD